MIAVVAVAVVLSVRPAIERRRVLFQQRAAALERPYLLAMVDLSFGVDPSQGCVGPVVDPETVQGLPVDLDKVRLRALYFQRMRRKYERAAKYPWLPVAPDPPEPK